MQDDILWFEALYTGCSLTFSKYSQNIVTYRKHCSYQLGISNVFKHSFFVPFIQIKTSAILSCNAFFFNVSGCKATAKTLYTGTTMFGCSFYKNAQEQACYCQPQSKKFTGDEF